MITGDDRSVGVEAALGPDSCASLAAFAECCGYASFWLNARGAGIDPALTLGRALAATSRIEVGVGLFPLDAYPAADLAARLDAAGGCGPRAIVGLAGGQLKQGMLAAVEGAIALLRRHLPGTRIAVGGYGPRILELGGRSADAILGNWLTPERLDWTIGHVASGARAAGRPVPPVYLYHRAARGEAAVARLKAELAEYRHYPMHERHQAAMGNPDLIGVAASRPDEVAAALAPYRGRCHVVLRPLPAHPADVQEWRDLIAFFAPDVADRDAAP